MNASFTIKSDFRSVDIPWTLAQLHGEYFGLSRTEDELREQCRKSLCFSLWHLNGLGEGFDEPCGFARVISDYVSFAQISDVFISEPFRRRGLGRMLLDAIHRDARIKTCTFNLYSRSPEFYRRMGYVEQSHMMRRPE